MKRIKAWVLAASALAISACAGDNPENVPEYGQWETQTELTSVTLDGLVIPPSQMPSAMLAVNGGDSLCGEPMFINREWQEADINRKLNGKCTLDHYEVTPSRVTGAGRCENIDPQADFSPEFDLDIAQSAQSYRMRLVMKGMATLPNGSQHYVSAVAVQEGTRTGEC